MFGTIRVLVIDDHLLFRKGVTTLLNKEAGIQVAGEAGNYWEAMQFLRANPCDVAIVDLSLPGRDGLDLIESIKANFPKLSILVLTMHTEDEYATRAIRGGANGFITKDSTEHELIESIRRVANGLTAISHKVAEVVAVQLSRKPNSENDLAGLSRREFKIYEMLAQGCRVTDIANDLNLSIKTVSTYKIRLMHKLGLQNQCDIVRHHLGHFPANGDGHHASAMVEP